MILQWNLKLLVQRYLNKQVTGVIVTVPTLFNPDQISATKRAIELAGLELKYLLHEPIAAAIAYNHRAKLGDSKILIFDFGGGIQLKKIAHLLVDLGTLDISIAEIKNGKIRVKAVTGDGHLGQVQNC